MQLKAVGTTEAAALDALYQREFFPMGTRSAVVECNILPNNGLDREPPLFEYVFDVIVPEARPVWSNPHPYDDAPLAVSMANTLDLNLSITGYANMHAPTHEEGMAIGRLAMFVRTFDRCKGAATIHHYRGCMTGSKAKR